MRNIITSESKVNHKDIENRNNHKSAIVWLTGLSGAGKSTISIETEIRLFKLGYNVFILDGDNLRVGLNN
ncbi:MAG TPA: adenylyl-sulfate kinase, partial [Bacteroidales bacterium]